ncbi:MAG: hypothetical protein RL641_654 [Candidatus Parcubacteria bacterium]|jgi:DNA-binding response OmpR family regulator
MRILIVEDQEKLARSIKKGLEQKGFAVDTLSDGESGMRRIEFSHKDYDLIILDIMLPGKSGLEICKKARAIGITLPILMLTARDTVENKIEGLNVGADDYLVKPFAFEELVARVRALLRRPSDALPSIIIVGPITLDTVQHTVTKNGKEVILSVKEFSILEQFMRRPNEIVSRETIISHVWDFASESFSNVVDAQIKNLRKKLQNKNENFFQTIHGVGYRFTA